MNERFIYYVGMADGKARIHHCGLVLLALCAISLVGCRRPLPGPSIDTGPDAERTPDGLVHVSNSGLALAYVKPGADPSSYDKMLVKLGDVSYQGKPSNPGAWSGNTFKLSDPQMAELRSLFLDAFNEQVAKAKGFSVASEPGPRTLVLNANIVDLVIRVQTKPSFGQGSSLVERPAALTLVGEIQDSVSSEVLVRFGDRKEVDHTQKAGINMKQVMVVSDIKGLFKEWAVLLRQRLDEQYKAKP